MSVGRTDGVAAGQLHTVTVLKDDKGYGMTVSGNDPVVVQSVVKGGAAWRVGVRTGDRLLAVNNTSVETSEHTQVVQLIRSSPTVVLRLQRHSTITAPLPVGREKQRQVELTKVQTIHLMLENEIRYIETLRSTLARGGSDRKMSELEAAEGRRAKLQQQIDLLLQTSPGSPRHSDQGGHPDWTSPGVPQQRQGFLSHLPRSLSNLTGQSIKSIRNSVNSAQASPVTCLDGAPPPLPPRGPPHPPPPPPPPFSQGVPQRAQHRHHHTAPNSIAVQMAYPLVAVTPPLIQNAVPGHHRSKSSPEELNLLNNTNEDKDWEMVTTPPGTPPPPYPSPPPPQIAIDPQRAIISMEEDDSPTLSRSMFLSGGFSCVESLSVARLAVFLNWVAGERRPAQALLLYLLTDIYSTGQAAGLARWAYELHSAFLVPGAPLALSSVDENMAREIDDALINEHDKEDVLRRIFYKVREKAKEELAQQLTEFQNKRQLGLGTFFGPTDAVLEQCDLDKTQETAVVMEWLVPRLAIWAKASSGDHWSATYGSPAQALLAAAIPPLLQHTFCLKSQMISSVISPGLPGSPPRPAFLQRDKLFKQRMKHINKSTNHPLVIRGHHLSPITVTSVCHCHQCHLLIWGIAPQAYNCSDCKLRVHRSCARQVEEPCCGPTAAPTRISRLMEKLTTAPVQPQPIGSAYPYEASNHQHHHHHEKKPKKSSTSSHFLNMERNSRRAEDDSMSALDNSATSHNTSGESKRDDDNGADTVSQMTDTSHFSSEHSADRTENNSQQRGGPSVAARPVTRAESYRDRADRVKRTKRKTSDPNQLTSSKDYHDAEVVAGATSGPGAPSGGSSNSSLSSKSNDSSHPDNQGGSQSDWSEEEDIGTAPWSSRAPPKLLASMSGVARKRQDLIHELIGSESSHVRWLRVLRRVYHVPLQRAGAALLPPQELRSLLPNLPDVLQRHRRLAQELRTLQQNPKVPTGPVADALISMLGEGRYASALARFCGGQGLALDALKERRKRNKELNSFLARSEQDPLCARLRLQDLLACVWQRLTKYQLLLEGIMKTAHALDDESPGPEGTASNLEDFAKVSHALELAKDVLNTVNTAIKTTENEHRLKTIQSKLEIRGAGGTEATEAELRRLDLARHSLIMEGSLSIKQDSNKRVNVLALLLKECLVLLHTDGERYILRPIPQTTHQPLSPVIQWSAVIFRPNAAVKNCFFLVNINGSQMYELSTSSASEYNTWTKRLLDAATALEPRPGVTEEGTTQPIPPTQNTTATAEAVPNGAPAPEPTNEDEPTPPKPAESEDDGNQVNGALATVVSEEEAGISGPPHKMDTSLLEPAILTITQPPVTQVATVEITPEERLRRAEEKVTLAMAEAVEAAQDVSGSSVVMMNAAQSIVADQIAQDSTEKLLLSAQDHVNKLTEVLLRALRDSNTSGCAMTKCSIYTDHGLCDTCTARHSLFSHSSHGHSNSSAMADSKMAADGSKMAADTGKMAADKLVPNDVKQNDGNSGFNAEEARDENLDSMVLFEEVGESSTDPNNDSDVLLVKSSGSGLRGIITELLTRLPELERDRQVLRSRLQQAENRIHLLHQLHKDCNHSEESGKQQACGEVAIPNSAEQGSGDG